jgi:methionyl-tRNA formyltransferase
VVFFGTSEFAVPILRAMAREHDVALVVTQPDRPSGRGLATSPSPVRAQAVQLKLAVETPEKLDGEAVARVLALEAHVLACASYGKILPKALLGQESMTAFNVHPSALPKYRGATPIQAALLAGDATTAVTIMWMAPRMDAGDIALQVPVEIEPVENYGSLHDRLSEIGARTLLDALELLQRGELPRVAQQESAATYTRPIAKDDLELHFTETTHEVERRIRAYAPRPGAWMTYAGRRLKILAVEPESGAPSAPMGTVTLATDGTPLVYTRDGAIRLITVVPEGKRSMSGLAFARGLRP